eukprot:978507-Alexandrium_andersonii.AAC.1
MDGGQGEPCKDAREQGQRALQHGEALPSRSPHRWNRSGPSRGTFPGYWLVGGRGDQAAAMANSRPRLRGCAAAPARQRLLQRAP